MGVKDLFKYLIDADVFADTSETDIKDHYILVDYNSFFYACMYQIKFEDDIQRFPHIVANKLSSLLTPRTSFFIDRGHITPKTEERIKRKNREANEIELKIIDDREKHVDNTLRLLGCQTEERLPINHSPLDDHSSFADRVKYSTHQLAVYANNFDAEYAMVVAGKKLIDSGESVVLVSNDQDTLALSIVNTPQALIVYQGAFYRLKQERSAIKYAQLITYVTVLCNKSDYFNGIKQLTAKNFLDNYQHPYTFDIQAQAMSDEVIEVNVQLMRDLVSAIKIGSVKESYIEYVECDGIMRESFTAQYRTYIRNVSRFLSLDTTFFL
jgi:hypothetical protein